MDFDAKTAALDVRAVGNTIIVNGELDVASTPKLTDAIDQITEGPIDLDLADVGFIDSSGVGAIVSAHQRLAAQERTLTISRRSPVVTRVFDVSGVDAILGDSP